MNRIDDLNNPAVLMKRLHHWRLAFFGLVILLAGIGIGAGAMFMVRPVALTPEDQAFSIDQVARTLRYRLDLTEEQSKDIRPVLYDCLRELNRIRQEARPAISEELEHMSEGIASILNDAQLDGWKKMQKKLMDQFHGNRIYRTVQVQAKTPPKPQRSTRQQRQTSQNPKTGARPKETRESDATSSAPKTPLTASEPNGVDK